MLQFLLSDASGLLSHQLGGRGGPERIEPALPAYTRLWGGQIHLFDEAVIPTVHSARALTSPFPRGWHNNLLQFNFLQTYLLATIIINSSLCFMSKSRLLGALVLSETIALSRTIVVNAKKTAPSGAYPGSLKSTHCSCCFL